ncbi:MAG: homocysteine S-methyltransferase [Planctomycetota bacterium]|nr:homocysteine S-methyltransferase [Planctomycetota bacterium]
MINSEALADRLERQGLLILDGGLGSEIAERGHAVDGELWSARLLLDAPAVIQDVHEAFLEAGADVITSASYQASIDGFVACGIARDEALYLISSSVTIADAARRARRPDALVAASIGPYGAALGDGSEYSGNYDLDQRGLTAWHEPRFAALSASGADLLACETVPSIVEARALAGLLDNDSAARAWVSFSCRDARHVVDGTPIAECAALLDEVDGALAIGVNCTTPAHVLSLTRQVRNKTRKPIVVYPNRGRAWDAEHKRWTGDNEVGDLVELAPLWRDAGARLIGGCCETRPADIARLRAAV